MSSHEFATTRWSVVLAAGRRTSPAARQALEDLCRRYWPPLYAYVRGRVEDVEAARDLTQEFFARLLEKNTLAAADPERGRFRAFLLTACKNFLANERDRARAAKRGGGRPVLSLDFDAFDSRCGPVHDETPERIYLRQWALTVLAEVLAALRAEYADAAKEALFDHLKAVLAGGAASYAELGAALGMTEGAVKVAAHRLRQRYRDRLRAEVAQTLDEGADVDDEIRELFACL